MAKSLKSLEKNVEKLTEHMKMKFREIFPGEVILEIL